MTLTRTASYLLYKGFFSRLINSLFQVKISPEAQNNNNNNNTDDDENDQDFNDKRQFAGNFDEENQVMLYALIYLLKK